MSKLETEYNFISITPSIDHNGNYDYRYVKYLEELVNEKIKTISSLRKIIKMRAKVKPFTKSRTLSTLIDNRIALALKKIKKD